MKIRATQRFMRNYNDAQPLRKMCAAGALGDLRRSFESDPTAFLRDYNKIKGMSPAVWEMDLSGSERLLFHHRDDAIYLLTMGGHEIVKRYKQTAAIENELKRMVALPDEIQRFSISGFFTFNVEQQWRQYADEADPSWLTSLDGEQSTAVNRILKQLVICIDSQTSFFALVTGGPGTGKTAILLNLLYRSVEQDIMPSLIMEDQVVEFLQEAGNQDVTDWRTTLHEAERRPRGGILLIDDPGSIREIRKAKWLAAKKNFSAVVVAVDPLQLEGDATDAEIEELMKGNGVDHISLRVCYRQKEVVGRATKKALDTIAASSPFLRGDKKTSYAFARSGITKASNELEFVNPSGRSKVYAAATLEDVTKEVSRLQRAPNLWTHAKPFLIAQDDEELKRLPSGWLKALQQLRPAKWILMDEGLSVKGIEFQHVIFILSEHLFLQLEGGFEGASKSLYQQRRLYRIPLSRAKDSLTVFVVPGSSN